MAFSDSTMSENSFLFTSESVGEVSKFIFRKENETRKSFIIAYCAIKKHLVI